MTDAKRKWMQQGRLIGAALAVIYMLSGCSMVLDFDSGKSCSSALDCDATHYCADTLEQERRECALRDNCITSNDCAGDTTCKVMSDGLGNVCTSSSCGDGFVEAPELCDGDCPMTCDDADACTMDALEGTAAACSAVCVHVPVTLCNLELDGCCPMGCTASTDGDCKAECGNGILEPGETCEGDECPTSCDESDACNPEVLVGSALTCDAACISNEIVECSHGDGCCADGCTQLNDADCDAECGNGILEDGELCDGDCPTTCNDGLICTHDTLVGGAETCDAMCGFAEMVSCTDGDGCCAEGCSRETDDDCDAICGDGLQDPGETCDGDCPQVCDDGNACTVNTWSGSADSCDLLCSTSLIAACENSDGCCPVGCHAGVDDDCVAICGNGIIEGAELCDGACPQDCHDNNACTADTVSGSIDTCDAQCSFDEILSCIDGDGCCASGCDFNNDNDCSSSCGNGILDAGETCDGDCPISCNDSDVCTDDGSTGSWDTCSLVCTHQPVLSCIDGDGCCAPGCSQALDNDCEAVCGNGVVELAESCDDGDSTDDGNGCSAACVLNAVCGDGLVQPLVELCDDGFTDACGSCNATCTGTGAGSSCGDASVCPEFEACDDGFADTCGTCNADCTNAGTGYTCGDGEVCPEAELCDDGFADACGACNATCTGTGAGSSCGDGVVCPEFEACDDGYADACGSCNSDCTASGTSFTCGDGSVCAEFEICDDSFTDACGTCNTTCSALGLGSSCGNGEMCPEFESCDDGYTDACGTCNVDCSGAGTGSACGDGSVCAELEICDDGFVDACGTCNSDCTASGTGSVCGNGEVCAEFETCDDSESSPCGACNETCSGPGIVQVCGDGVHCPEAEACDDGYTDMCGTCNFNCTAPGSGSTCGDGAMCPETEACDDGFNDTCGSCNSDCTASGEWYTCGDGVRCEETEVCDDGNTNNCDGCAANCWREDNICGDSIEECAEGCDDGNTVSDGNGCSATCELTAICGDGIVQSLVETCDDGYTDACGSCNANCTAAGSGSICGDGNHCPEFEYCDDGNNVEDDGCTSSCSDSLCGDGLLNQRLLAVTSLTFRFAAINCGGGVVEAVFQVNGAEFARAEMTNACYCGDRVQSITITDESLLETLQDGNNTFSYSLEGSDGYTYWTKVQVDDTGEEVVIYEQDSGTATADAAIPCGTSISSISETVTAAPALFDHEPCDDGNTTNGDGCDNNCTVTACGNGVAAGAEACDTAGNSSTCDEDCTAVQCGDGLANLGAGETCDDGNSTSDDGCSDTCQLEYCGDGVVQAGLGEACDDGNQLGGDGCSFGCLVEVCGDAVISEGAGEECDDGNTFDNDGCSSACLEECGDGVLAAVGGEAAVTLRWKYSWYTCSANQASELWVYVDGAQVLEVSLAGTNSCGEHTEDLSNPVILAAARAGTHLIEVIPDGCWIATWMDLEIDVPGTSLRTVSLFDPFEHNHASLSCDDYNYVDIISAEVFGESCDDGNSEAGDGCSESCDIEACGNAVLDSDESCDDGNLSSGDGCSATCAHESCGDGSVNGYEECDGSTGCTSDCLLVACGNGRIESGEGCDDGNLSGGDGCSSICMIEVCGNGAKEVGEGCDDGGTVSGDGCSASCEIEGCSHVVDTDGDGLADCVETDTGIYVSTGNTGTSPTDPDSDGDGFSDGDEVLGTSGGLNLAGMGANPNYKDVFLEADWTTDDASSNCGGTELRPPESAFLPMIEAFADSPVPNRNGDMGVALHVDYGQGNGFTGGNLIAEADSFLNGALGGDFLEHKAANFAANREGYFHYSIRAFKFGYDGVPSNYGGLGQKPGYTFLVTQGCPGDHDVRTYMHELGHNLGLGHGGFESCNYKPNYNSIMNYKYSGGAFRDCGLEITGDLIFSIGEKEDLDETALNESLGICEEVPMDWNSDGDYGVVQVDINSSEPSQSSNCGGTYTVLRDHNDWENILYLGPMSPNGIFLDEEVD